LRRQYVDTSKKIGSSETAIDWAFWMLIEIKKIARQHAHASMPELRQSGFLASRLALEEPPEGFSLDARALPLGLCRA